MFVLEWYFHIITVKKVVFMFILQGLNQSYIGTRVFFLQYLP